METYTGFVETLEDAVMLLEACRQGYLKRIQRRLTDTEKTRIESGSVWIWDEEEAQIKRWTDKRNWSPSRRMLDRFLVYNEIERNLRKGGSQTGDSPNESPRRSFDDNSSSSNYQYDADADGEQQSFHPVARKEGGLSKRCLSVTTADGRRQHLVAYYYEEDAAGGKLMRPWEHSNLRGMTVDWRRYPDVIQNWPEELGNGMDYSHQESSQHSAASSTWSAHAYPAHRDPYAPLPQRAPMQHRPTPSQYGEMSRWDYPTPPYAPPSVPQHMPSGPVTGYPHQPHRHHVPAEYRPHYNEHVSRPEHHRMPVYHPYAHHRALPLPPHSSSTRHSPHCTSTCCRPAYNRSPTGPTDSFAARMSSPTYIATASRQSLESISPSSPTSPSKVTLPSFAALVNASVVPRNGQLHDMPRPREPVSRSEGLGSNEYARTGEWRRSGEWRRYEKVDGY